METALQQRLKMMHGGCFIQQSDLQFGHLKRCNRSKHFSLLQR